MVGAGVAVSDVNTYRFDMLPGEVSEQSWVERNQSDCSG